MSIEFKKHLIVNHVRKYCKTNGIKLIISNKGLGNMFDPESRIMHIEDTKGKSLSYKLFILSHEYGHLFQYVMDQDSLNLNSLDESIYHKLMLGEVVESTKKKKMIRALLTEEHRATTIGLQYLKVHDCYPAYSTLKMIKRQANINMIRYYMRLHYGYEVSGLKHLAYKIPNSHFVIPMSKEFNELVKKIRPQLKLENDIKQTLDKYYEYN
jgi:hypothetical protein